MNYTPPKGTVPTLIHDIYGQGILVYFPVGDDESPRNCERGICQAQLDNGKRRKRGNNLAKAESK